MIDNVTLYPGRITLNEWRQVVGGAAISLDSTFLPLIEKCAASVERIVARGEAVYGINTGFGKLAAIRIPVDDLTTLQRNIVLSHAAGVGAPTDADVVRTMMSLKVASLGRGASGVRPSIIDALIQMLVHDAIPIIPQKGSVGASGDLAPLAHMTATMLGEGEITLKGDRMPARDALAQIGLTPLTLGPKEGLALLNGTQFSTAAALVAAVRLERVFQTALLSGALSLDASKGSTIPFDSRIHALRGHPGQIEVAAAFQNILAGSEIRDSHDGCAKVQDPYCLRCQPQVMGAILDLARNAIGTLTIESNGVTDNPLVFADDDEALSGGNFHAEPVAFAADQLAMATCEIGSITERRIAMLTDPALSGLPAFLTPHPGLNSGFMIPQVTAAALVSENKQKAFPASVDSVPTSANQEDHVSMAAHGAYRLLDMVETTLQIVAIELLAAAQGCDFHTPLRSSGPLEKVRASIRSKIPTLQEDRFFSPDIAAAAGLIRDGSILDAVDSVQLPSFSITTS